MSAGTTMVAAVRALGDERAGLGPLAALLADPAVTDVLVNGPGEIWVERDGHLERVPLRFASTRALTALVQRVVAPLGLRIDEARPWVDARLEGGERFHAVLPPLAPDGPIVTIRTFSRRRLGLGDLVERGTLDATTGRLLEGMVAVGVATLVSGSTGSGKTTLLNVLGAAIPRTERVVTVEDAQVRCTRSKSARSKPLTVLSPPHRSRFCRLRWVRSSGACRPASPRSAGQFCSSSATAARSRRLLAVSGWSALSWWTGLGSVAQQRFLTGTNPRRCVTFTLV